MNNFHELYSIRLVHTSRTRKYDQYTPIVPWPEQPYWIFVLKFSFLFITYLLMTTYSQEPCLLRMHPSLSKRRKRTTSRHKWQILNPVVLSLMYHPRVAVRFMKTPQRERFPQRDKKQTKQRGKRLNPWRTHPLHEALGERTPLSLLSIHNHYLMMMMRLNLVQKK